MQAMREEGVCAPANSAKTAGALEIKLSERDNHQHRAIEKEEMREGKGRERAEKHIHTTAG